MKSMRFHLVTECSFVYYLGWMWSADRVRLTRIVVLQLNHLVVGNLAYSTDHYPFDPGGSALLNIPAIWLTAAPRESRLPQR